MCILPRIVIQCPCTQRAQSVNAPRRVQPPIFIPTQHNKMTSMEAALAKCDAIPSDKDIPWQTIADKHGVVRLTLTRKHRGNALTRRGRTCTSKSSTRTEGRACGGYREADRAKAFTTREMVQIYASDIAGHPLFESWVSRFLNRHINELASQ